mmetsp:Transcript_16860/g.34130  ORF Transcript_16860/g.34130 Transcript_16860/m.34130 type:complete len:82 (+) Transcript_16860:778-1023(+)
MDIVSGCSFLTAIMVSVPPPPDLWSILGSHSSIALFSSPVLRKYSCQAHQLNWIRRKLHTWSWKIWNCSCNPKAIMSFDDN